MILGPTSIYHASALLSTLCKKSARDLLFKAAKKPMDLFPRVTRADAILFIVQCHGPCHGKMRVSSRPMECKMTTLMIDESNVSTFH